MDSKSSVKKNASPFSRNSSLNFVIALNLCIVVICFSWALRKLFQIYHSLIETEYLLVLILWISCMETAFEILKEDIRRAF